MKTIGIIGLGYVGSAVAASYSNQKILVNDIKDPVGSASYETMMSQCSAIFVCVPTDSGLDGACDTSILENVLHTLQGYGGIIIGKCTAPPQVYVRLQDTLQINLAHVPEFLTQARAGYDYINPHKIVVGCEEKLRSKVTEILMLSDINFNKVNIEYCDIACASLFKYFANSMLAVKVVLNNEFAELATKLGVDWESITRIAFKDSRLGHTHWAVPGPDNQKGFGGSCFPKDTAALVNIAVLHDVELSVLSTALLTNKALRNKKSHELPQDKEVLNPLNEK